MRVILLPVVAAIVATVGCKEKPRQVEQSASASTSESTNVSLSASANAADTIIRRVKADRDTIIRNSAGSRDTIIVHVKPGVLPDSCLKVPRPADCPPLRLMSNIDTIPRP